MKYRVLKLEDQTSTFAPVIDKEFKTEHADALAEAEAYVKGRSGRRAIVVAERDTFTSQTVTKHTPGSEA